MDEGGGIARSRLAEVWSYRGARLAGGFGLAARSDADELVRSPEASAGLGLPLARLHCKFFGGSLHLTPMEDGTDSNTNINTDFHTHLVLKHGVAVYPQQRPGWGRPPPAGGAAGAAKSAQKALMVAWLGGPSGTPCGP